MDCVIPITAKYFFLTHAQWLAWLASQPSSNIPNSLFRWDNNIYYQVNLSALDVTILFAIIVIDSFKSISIWNKIQLKEQSFCFQYKLCTRFALFNCPDGLFTFDWCTRTKQKRICDRKSGITHEPRIERSRRALMQPRLQKLIQLLARWLTKPRRWLNPRVARI